MKQGLNKLVISGFIPTMVVFILEISENEYEFKATIKEFHLNKREITHGGFICSLIDTGAGTAVYRTTGQKSYLPYHLISNL